MRVGRAGVRAHGAGGRRGAGRGSAMRESSRGMLQRCDCRGTLSPRAESYDSVSLREVARVL